MTARSDSYRAGSVAPTVIVVMGVSGCGKSTVAALLAQRMQCPFYEGDAYHPAANVEKMRSGIPLTDADRAPWLAELAAIVEQHCSSHQPAVLSCSALTPAYRQQLVGAQTLVTAAGLVTPGDLCLDSQEAVSSKSAEGPENNGSNSMGATHPGDKDYVAGRHRVLNGGIGGELPVSSSGQAGQRRQRQQNGSLQVAGSSGYSTQVSVGWTAGGPGSRPATTSVQQPCIASVTAEEERGRSWTEGVGFILLEPSREHLQRWLAQRAASGAHFMPPSLLDSQLASLQYAPEELYCHIVGDPFPVPADIVLTILQQLDTAGIGRI